MPDQLTDLKAIAEGAQSREAHWRSPIPYEIRPEAGRINIADFYSLMRNARLHGSSWIRQFIFGFPLVGALSQQYTYPLDDEVDVKPGLPPKLLLISTRPRFEERPRQEGKQNMKDLRGEAPEQHLKGWAASPFLLDFSSSCTAASKKLNIAIRFGVSQVEKKRAFDDLRRSMANLDCSVLTPTRLVSWGHVADLCRKAISPHSDWEFPKADHEAAY